MFTKTSHKSLPDSRVRIVGPTEMEKPKMSSEFSDLPSIYLISGTSKAAVIKSQHIKLWVGFIRPI